MMDNVTLNIYDLLPESRSQQQPQSSSSPPQPQRTRISNFFSGLLSPLGLGAYHTSIDVRGFRYQFGANMGITRSSAPESGGETALSLRFMPPNVAHQESIILGQTWCKQAEINATIQRMTEDKFTGDNYHLANRNCNHFSETFAMALILGDDLLEDSNVKKTLEKYPTWVNRLARTGTSLGINDGKACVVVAEARIAAGLKGKVGWTLSPSKKKSSASAPGLRGKIGRTLSSSNKNGSASAPSRSQKKELTEKQKAVLAKLKKGSK